jgi:anti-sigma B factor antagonist
MAPVRSIDREHIPATGRGSTPVAGTSRACKTRPPRQDKHEPDASVRCGYAASDGSRKTRLTHRRSGIKVRLSPMGNNDIVTGFDDETDDRLEIRLEKVNGVDGCLTIYLEGNVDTYNANVFLKRVRRAIDSGYFKLILNCAGLGVVSSDIFGCFADFLKKVKPKGGDLVLLQVQPKVYEVFQLLGLSRFYNIRNTLDEAVAFFKGETAATAAAPRRPATTTGAKNAAVFPKVFACPVCDTKLKASGAGRFRCSSCKTVLVVDGNGKVARA